ncbi:single-stranded DNA-binding protein [Blastococcus jejuensis]|uniref:Single-stranded DNA-binding protein n=1 Tax=Blastococcus jejuensis TaxID=351224 RepID=A0ABP6P841_9ACTN
MNDTIVTVVGNVVDSPRRASLATGTVTNFRMASTARRYDSRTEQFVDSGTFWVDVECWSELAGNVAASVSKGDPVIVHGTLTTHEWESENGTRSKPRIKAAAVGPNLKKGRSMFTRDRFARTADPAAAEAAESAVPRDGAEEDFPSVEDLQAGRDYISEEEAFDQTDTDLQREPAHA